jgi:hypothetical protein
MHTFFKAALSASLAAMLLGAAPLRVADPMTFMKFLVGRWNCTSTVAGKTQTYTATYAYALGGKWLRTINSSKGYSSEDMMTYGNHEWTVVDMEPTGAMSVLKAPDTGAAHIAMQTAYPKPGLNVTFDRASWTKYSLTFSGTLNGKPAKWKDTCTKI